MQPTAETIIAPTYVLLFGIAIACGLWAAAVAGTKQRSQLGFGAIGFLFGLVGVLIAFAASPGEPKRG